MGPVHIFAKKTAVMSLKGGGKIYYFLLRLMFMTACKFSSTGASSHPCPLCGKQSGKTPHFTVRSNDPKLYDKRTWATALYDLTSIAKFNSIHRYIHGQKSYASNFARLGYYLCNGCDSFFKNGAHLWRLKFEVKPDHYSNSYRTGQIYGRPILMNSPRITNWSRHVLGFFPDPAGVKILDMGCAEGYQVLKFKELGFKSYGLEPNPAMCNYATQTLRIEAANIKDSYYETDCYEPESFDAITSYHTIEHCPNPKNILSSAFIHLKNGGLLFLSTPSASASFIEFKNTGRNLNFVDSHDFIMSKEAIEALALEVGFLKISANNFNGLNREFGVDELGEKEGGMNFVFQKP